MSEINFFDIVAKSRSYRQFHEEDKLSREVLYNLASLARLTPSAGNLQPLRYRLVYNDNEKDVLFNSLFWAAYLKNWDGPKKGKRPGGYIIIGKKTSVKGNHWMFDAGIAAQTIMLQACNIGYGGCMIASFKEDQIKQAFFKENDLDPVLVLALGRPFEEVVIEDISESGNIKYFRDNNDVHHVPKILCDELIKS